MNLRKSWRAVAGLFLAMAGMPFEPISKQIAANHLAAMGKEQP